ncbi:TPA: hypothetical protein ACHH0J_001599 [Staphylococcus aureus]
MRWKNALQNKLPATYKEALAQLLETVEEKEKSELENNMNKQKIAEYEPKSILFRHGWFYNLNDLHALALLLS